MAISKENKKYIDTSIHYYISEASSYKQIAENYVPEVESVVDTTFGIIVGNIYFGFMQACKNLKVEVNVEDLQEFNKIIKDAAPLIKKAILAETSIASENNEEKQDEIVKKEVEIEEKIDVIQEKKDEIVKKEVEIEEKIDVIQEKKDEIVKKEVEIEEKIDVIEKKSEEEKTIDDFTKEFEKITSKPSTNIIHGDEQKKDAKDKQSISQKFKTSPILQGFIIGLIATVIFYSIIWGVNYNSFNMVNDALEPDIMQGDLIRYQEVPFSSIKENDIVVFSNPSGELIKVGIVRNAVDVELGWIKTSNNVEPSSFTTVTEKEYIGKITSKIPQVGSFFAVFNGVIGIAVTPALFVVPIIVMKLRKKTHSKINI